MYVCVVCLGLHGLRVYRTQFFLTLYLYFICVRGLKLGILFFLWPEPLPIELEFLILVSPLSKCWYFRYHHFRCHHVLFTLLGIELKTLFTLS